MDADDQPDFLHLLMEERVGRQMKRLLGMLVVYMTTLVWAVHFPVVALTSLLPQHFPFRQQFSNPTTGEPCHGVIACSRRPLPPNGTSILPLHWIPPNKLTK